MPLKYVKYDKIYPPPLECYDEDDIYLYKFVGRYCGFFPQVWLSRSRSSITGIKRNSILKRSRIYQKNPGWRSNLKLSHEKILFGFDIIKGFPIAYDHWEFMMNALFEARWKKVDVNSNKLIPFLTNHLNQYIKWYKEDNAPLDGETKDWSDSGCNMEVFLKKYLFVEKDQVVVPSLNLKSAKKIICSDEKQKRELRKMGFIEDRIEIKNIKPRKW